MKKKHLLIALLWVALSMAAQTEQKVQFFPLNDIELLESPFKHAQELDKQYLLELDADRLLAPFLKEAGLSPKAEGYTNWEKSGLNGHIGGHYLSALSQMAAATGDKAICQRLDYMISELKRAQEANGNEMNESPYSREKDSCYLFTYFTADRPDAESIYFALSEDGYNYKTLNSGNPVIKGDSISDRGGVRDPHILRGKDGSFLMVATDMKVSNGGWESNHGIVMLKSKDLIHWSHTQIDLKALFPKEFGSITRAWAPQTIYDEENGKYMIYFSMKKQSEHQDILYYAYANPDFTAIESTPRQLFFHPSGKSCIDGDIVYKDGKYHLFFKTEGDGNGIKKAVSENLTHGYVLQDNFLQQTSLPVEGSCVFKLSDQDKYIMMYDVYKNKKYEFTESRDLGQFHLCTRKVNMDFSPRHGTVISITREEADRLTRYMNNKTPL